MKHKTQIKFLYSLLLLISFTSSFAKKNKTKKTHNKNKISHVQTKNIHTKTIVGVTIPKCGSHMLKKCITMLVRKRFSWAGGDFTRITKHALQNQKNGILFAHAPYTQENKNAVDSNDCNVVFIYRDPRDMVVSFAFWLKKRRRRFNKFTPQELMKELISDMSLIKGASGWHNPIVSTFKGIDDFYAHYLLWIDNPKVYATTFEKLVGPKGGGDAALQLQEVENIVAHLELEVSQEKIKEVINKMFGHSLTFRKGQIGSWKEHFTPEMKELFKEVAGQLLIDLGYEKDFDW